MLTVRSRSAEKCTSQSRRHSLTGHLYLALIILLAVSGCGAPAAPTSPFPPTVTSSSATLEATATPPNIAAATFTPTPPNNPTATATQPGLSSTPSPDTRLSAHYWREWPSVPELSAYAQDILLSARANPDLDLHAFSKVGDCQMTSDTFLGGYATGAYRVPGGLEATVQWFQTSLTSESITAANGLGINSILNPLFGRAAGHVACGNTETPLDCELRTQRPVVVLIAMGTNWKPNGEVSFEKHLRVVVDRVLETGALPVLATKGDNIEGDWKLNRAIAQVAYDYDLPLVNVWRAVQPLPNHGLQSPENIYLTGDAWMLRNEAWLKTLDAVRNILDQNNPG